MLEIKFQLLYRIEVFGVTVNWAYMLQCGEVDEIWELKVTLCTGPYGKVAILPILWQKKLKLATCDCYRQRAASVPELPTTANHCTQRSQWFGTGELH
jgi:hypothetical protein